MVAQTAGSAPLRGGRLRTSVPAAGVLVGVAVATPAALMSGSKTAVLLLAGVVALTLGLYALISPVFATVLLLVAMFLRIPARAAAVFPIDVFLIAFAATATATVLWMDRTPDRLRGLGLVEWAMAFLVMWNVYSMFAPHKYSAINPLVAESFSVFRFIVVGTVIPFAMYVVGRYTFVRASAVRALLWSILVLAAYSAAVSILPFTPLSGLVWPRYIVEIENPGWAGRAVGIFNQPVVNGMVLGLGFAIAMFLMARREDPTWQRCIAFGIGIGCGVGIYETHTRAAWLGGLCILIIGAILAKGYRQRFITVLGLLAMTVAVNWSTFTSADRGAGGVAQQGEVDSRLNDIQTAFWAIARKPVEGWGIGRFQSVNTYHHQQWTPETPWTLGFGEVSHQNELAIFTELGVIGLAAWIAVLVLIAFRLWDTYQSLPDRDLCGKPLVVIAIMAMSILICSGATVDLRFCEFAVTVIFLLVGIAVGWADRVKCTPAPLECPRRPTHRRTRQHG